MTIQALALSPSREQSAQRDDDVLYLGGVPRLPAGTPWPTCRRCGADLTFYLHLAMPDGFAWAGRAVNVFACTARCAGPDVAPDAFRGYNTGDEVRVPPSYVPLYAEFFRLVVTDTAISAPRPGPGALLLFVRLAAKPTANTTGKGLRIGGEPAFPRSWPRFKFRYGERGGVAPFLFQLPRGVRFEPLPGVPAQESLRNRCWRHVCMGMNPPVMAALSGDVDSGWRPAEMI